jgi:hypothetical protein
MVGFGGVDGAAGPGPAESKLNLDAAPTPPARWSRPKPALPRVYPELELTD